MNAVQNVTDQDFQKEVLDSSVPVLVDFWAPWCAPCRALAPIVEEIAQEYREQLKVVKLNVDDNPETAIRYGIRGIPTLILFVNGKVAEQFIGLTTKERIVQAIRRHMKPSFE